jgi:cytochrome P450
MVFRMCSKDVEINGIKFKKGVRVYLPIWPLHHSEEYFPEPYKFKPERFLKENATDIQGSNL